MILASKNLIYKAVYHGARSLIEVFAVLKVEGWETIPEGAGLLACRSGAPVVPIHIRGARDVLPRGALFPAGTARIRVRFGRPLHPRDYDPGREHPERFMEASRRILAAIKDMPDNADPGL